MAVSLETGNQCPVPIALLSQTMIEATLPVTPVAAVTWVPFIVCRVPG